MARQSRVIGGRAGTQRQYRKSKWQSWSNITGELTARSRGGRVFKSRPVAKKRMR